MMALISIPVDDGFQEKFLVAENTFKYQLVYDPGTQLIVPLNPYPDGMTAQDFPYAGDPKLAKVFKCLKSYDL